MSADSGLATFATMTARMGDALGEGVTYDQAAGSDTMFKDPALFYGFWFTSMRNYEEASPHNGYAILKDWADRVRTKNEEGKAEHVVGMETSVFALTTNVDRFFLRSGVVAPQALYEIHGNVAKWHCGGAPRQGFPPIRPRCGDTLFDAP